jgi:YHS domain-containing protein
MVRLTAVAALLLSGSLTGAGEFYEKNGLALQGYDPVSYFTAAAPQLGVAHHAYTYKESTFGFVSAENRKLFVDNPEKYAPQYRGYCAYGTAHGHTASKRSSAFEVVDGKLYLNHTGLVRRLWRTDTAGNIAEANAKWPQVSQEEFNGAAD